MRNEKNPTENLERDLLLGFHNQFAENHNHQQNLFIKILIASMTIFSCYGMVLFQFLTNKAYSDFIFLLTSIIVIIVMTFLCCILISQGWSFRSSQIIVNSIRETFLGKHKHFFNNFGKTTTSLPNFYQINLVMCEVLKLIVVGITAYIQNLEFDENHKKNIVFLLIIVCSFIIEFCVHYFGYHKVQKKIKSKNLTCSYCRTALDDSEAMCLECAKKFF
jgi:hypothetical protein